MENKKSKTEKLFKFILYSLIVMFAFVYVSGKTGYYETHLKKNTLLTSEAIKEFEKDVASGRPVDIKDYINAEVKDYRNPYSKMGYNISSTVDTFLNEGLGKALDFLKALFT